MASNYNRQMITLNVQVGVNPLISHKPKQICTHSDCQVQFTVGENGELVGWKNMRPLFQMCPSVNAEADRMIALTTVPLRDIDQIREGIKLITLHNDNRLRIWAHDDGSCLNVSAPALFPQPIIALISPPVQTKFIIALAEENLYAVDCWLLKIVGKFSPKKESYARFKGGSINDKGELEIWDGNNRAYRIDLSSLLAQNFLDFGNYINDYDLTFKKIQKVWQNIAKIETMSYYKRKQPQVIQNLQPYQDVLKQMRQQTLATMIFCPQFLKDYPTLQAIFKNQQASISALHFIGGSTLYMLLGTESGKIFIIPISTRSNQPLILIKQDRKEVSPVRYIRIFNGNLFVSWENGWLGIYNMQNLNSHMEIIKINKTMQCAGKKEQEVFTANLQKLIVLEERLSSFMKYSLPAYHNIDGKLRGTFFFRLDRNQIIRFDEGSTKITHFRGIAEDVKQYVAVCTSKGVDMYSPLQHQRTITYQDWVWQDFTFLDMGKQNFEYRYSDYRNQVNNSNCLMKYCSRWVFDKLDYYSDGQGIFSQTFGDTSKLSNEQFPEYFFIQRGQVQKALHSRSNDSYSMILKMKLNRIRKDSWSNATYLVHGNLNCQLDTFQTQRGSPQDIVNKQFQFYMLLPWSDINIPFLSQQMKNLGKRVCLRRRQTAQGVGKTFTIYYEGGSRIKLSQRILCHEAVASVALLQCWVLKDVQATDYMVEAVQYFARMMSTLFSQSGDIILAKLAVSTSQNVSKGSINLIISKAITGKFNLHPIFQYFLLNIKGDGQRKLLSFNETVWLVYLGLGFIFTGQKIQKDQMKCLINRFINCMQQISNYQLKPYYLLTVMRVFNQGISKWKPFLDQNDISKLIMELFRIFFYYDGLSTVAIDDKKFNFCFSKVEDTLKRFMKQGIVKTIIYIGKEYPQEYHSVLKNQSINQKIHHNYPASVIQILRQYIKSERPQAHLVFYVELLLQCLSPMTPQLRKFVQKNALSTLQLLCTYNNVAFNQPSQKLSVKTQNHLYIYCLRTSTKWRTINLKDQKPHANPALVQMSPRGTYIALLSDKLRIWRLSSGFWSGVLGAFSQDWVFEVSGKGLKWDENEQSITVLNENPALNKVFKI